MVDYKEGYTSYLRVMRLNPDTWAPVEEVDGIRSVTINRSATDDIPLIESATMQRDTPINEEIDEEWWQVQMLAFQGGFERQIIGTFLISSGSGVNNYGFKQNEISGNSVLYPASERKMIDGPAYAAKGVNGAEFAADLLRKSTPAPVVVDDDGFILDSYVNFSVSESYLSAVWSILDAGGWVILLDGDGTIHICEKPETIALELNKENAGYLQPEINWEYDRSGIYNVWYAIEGSSVASARNDDPNSKTSTVSKKREIVYVDESPVRINGETLTAYCNRRLEESNTIVKSYSYIREYAPEVRPFTKVRATLSENGVEGDLRVLTQRLTCSYGITVDEKVGLEVKEWTA